MPPIASRRPSASVLVTGGAGMIGSRVTAGLLDAGARVVVADDLSAGRADRLPLGRAGLVFHPLDIAAPGAWRGLFGEEGPFDVVLHLAARVGVRSVLRDPERCRRQHLAAAHGLVDALASLPARSRPRVIAASTSEVYAEKAGPLAESDPLRPVDGRGRWAYAGSKRAVEEILDAAPVGAPGRGPIHLRLFNVVGPGQDAGSGMVLPRFVEAARADQPLIVHGDGGQLRTFAHVDDVAADLVTLAFSGYSGSPRFPGFAGGALNLGGEARATVLELAHLVLATVGSGAGVRFVDPRRRLGPDFEDVRWREPCLARARRLGLARRVRSLVDIVSDVAGRHPSRLDVSSRVH